MRTQTRFIDSFRFGRLSSAESATVWPILVVATLGFIAIGAILIMVARSTIERQTDHWIETSLRASATNGRTMVEARFTQAHELIDLIASRVLIRNYLIHRAAGRTSDTEQEISPKSDLESARRSSPAIMGITLLDNHGVVVATAGAIPALAHDAYQGQTDTIEPIIIADTPVFKAMQWVKDSQGAVIGSDIIYYRIDNLALSFQNGLDFGPGLSIHLWGVIDGTTYSLLPHLTRLTSADAELDAQLLDGGAPEEVILHDARHAISGIRLRLPNSQLVMALDLDPSLMERYHYRETSFLTVVLMALTLIGASGLTLLLKPLAMRLVRQRKQLDSTIDELRRAEQVKQRIMASIPDRIEILDREGRVISMTEGGSMASDLNDVRARRGAHWLSFWSDGDRQLATAALAEARTKNLGRFQGFCDLGSGTAKWWDVVVAPMLDTDGKVEELLVVSRDITDEKISEQRIAESERRYQMVASATNDVIWDWSIDTDTMWWNDAITSQFGYPQSDVGATAAWWAERVHPEDIVRVRDGLRAVISSPGSAWRAEYRFRKADGSYIHVLDRGHVLRNHAGIATRMIGALFDLSDRRRAFDLERRRSAHSLLRADVSASLVLSTTQTAMLQGCAEALTRHIDLCLARIWILDSANSTLVMEASSGLYTHIGDIHSRLALGETAIGMIAKTRQPFMTNDAQNEPQVSDQAWVQREGLVAFAGFPLMAGDVLIGVLGTFSMQRIESDAFDSLGVVADLIAQGVRRNALEHQLAMQATAMLRTNAELEQFTYVASHDLQEPLRTIANYLSLLERRYREQFDDKAKRHIDHTIAAAKRLQALIRDLLAYSRAGHNDTSPLEPVAGNEAFATAVSNLESAIGEVQAEITRDELPVIPYNPLHLIQLLQNLIGNAIKYHGPAQPTVRVSAVRREQAWEWAISDNGIGIDPRYHARIFEVFQRLHGRETFQGTGIGLALCKKIVESHGGRIWVESSPGQGAVFRFTTPILTPKQK